ncbi:hypothetical protein [Siphonobacter sp. SORGH_AS_0500]|uniref:hypothetical protein n=1 Tax=Siphonobacter sp. SORGH_AS_0500 TaxID=1864824 RepID=UPI0018E34BB4|nr:hypothetical protein [Siphonobacter sp. SORGH_AS_0500]MDR6193221.1 hypothetical protein [Siphonobacter sp. SORGH_AS_0500]
MTNRFWHIWTIPLLLAIVSLGGLISALVGNDLWDVLSWLTLSIPLLVIGRFWLWPQGNKKAVK